MKEKLTLFVSSLAFRTISEAIEFCNQNRVNIEIGMFARADNIDNTNDEELAQIKESLDKNNLKNIALHGACFSLCPSSLDKMIVEVTKTRLKQSVEIARKLGGKSVIFHSGYNSHIKVDNYIKPFIENQIKFWKQFIEENEINDLVILLENTYEDAPYLLREIYEGVDSEHFKCCIDIGHISAYSNYGLNKWIKDLEKYLYHFHLHNNYGVKDDHISVLKGNINFDEFLDIITELNMPLNLNLEIFDVNDVIESLEYVRKKLPL